MQNNQSIRLPFVAGTFYPAERRELNKEIDDFFALAEKTDVIKNFKFNNENLRTKALIVPHAGYIYSGATAGVGYKILQNSLKENAQKIKRVFILGSNHNEKAGSFKFSVFGEDYYQTPLGNVKISGVSHDLLKKYPNLFVTEKFTNQSHIIEVQLPFLQRVLGDFELISIITGNADIDDLYALTEVLENYLDDETLLIITSDLSHYHKYEDAQKLDANCIEAMLSLNVQELVKTEACGLPAILVLLNLADKHDWHTKLLDYKNSGDTAGDKSRVVGYSAITFYGDKVGTGNILSVNADIGNNLSNTDKEQLLSLARRVLEHAVNKTKNTFDEKEFSNVLKMNGAAFVTLTKNNELRGCIGDLIATRALYKSVIDNTVNAALHDPRFLAVEPSELAEINVEISVLTAPIPLHYNTTDDLLEALEPNVTGVILQKGFHKATFLPQVWEQLPHKEDFLGHLCMKAGLSADAWRAGNLKVQTYRAIKIN